MRKVCYTGHQIIAVLKQMFADLSFESRALKYVTE
ncbi:hypothetical protein EPIR_3049 [Erwinia piriflorinigrans CFBP 5888]|uniref:Uncharacterized protein n=1 Tax=Erwinia piriflorinigrans CFBP 5888 TaxID=1161919 RepID=V5ZBU3_9GAMM|nr:hypothetical protein EPIR_3049 [Erwinia piriflorinigrans CFBP 5888]